jgi:HD superfamily phosphohydrolase
MRTIRDPVWQNIPVDPDAAAILDAPEFQRLRRVKQLGFAHLAYPGAVHSRFLHALGVYHLTTRAIETLRRNGDLERLTGDERAAIPVVRLAALLHDVGHYAFSHAMEELGPESIPGHHEEVAARFLDAGPIRDAVAIHGEDAIGRIAELIRGSSDHPLQGLVAGSLDLDKIDYLRRDSFFCGVPYGAVDVERLLDALTLASETEGAPLEVAVTEKGISALESLLFSKYQMFRNVYWHHAVRAATVVFRRLIEGAMEAGLLSPDELAGPTDEELLNLLGHRLADPGLASAPPDLLERISLHLDALTNRRLPKRAVELMGDSLPAGLSSWVAEHPELVGALEERLEREWGLPPGFVILDYPGYSEMLQLRLLLVRRDGGVQRLTSRGEKGLIDLPRLSRSLHHTARVFRVFTLRRVEPKDPHPLLELIEASAEEVEARLKEARPLYG